MRIGPTDGNLHALAQHLDRQEEIRDGDPCPHCDEGRIVVTPPEEDDPRGSARCDDCGESFE